MPKRPYRQIYAAARAVIDEYDAKGDLMEPMARLRILIGARKPRNPRSDRGHGAAPLPEIEAALRRGGKTMGDVAREFGFSREYIRRIGLRIGLRANDLRATLPPSKAAMRANEAAARRATRAAKKQELVERVLALRDRKLRQREIAAAIGVKQSVVSTILIQNGRRTLSETTRKRISRFSTEAQVARKVKPAKSAKPPEKAPAIVHLRKGRQVPHQPATVEKALRLWNEGLSASRIAEQMTSDRRPINKNVIIGLAHRNNFPARRSLLRENIQ